MRDGESATPGHGRPPTSRRGRRAAGRQGAGIPAAELIARVTGVQGEIPNRRRGVRDTEATTEATEATEATTPIPVSPRTTEIPDLGALAHDGRRPAAVDPAAGKPRKALRDRRERGSGGRRRPALLAARTTAALIAVSALALTGSAWQWQSAKNKLFNTIAALDPDSSDIRDPNAQTGDENFLVIGVDSRIGENSEIGAGDTTMVEGARPDTIMLVNIPASRERVVAVSFPRDLAITPMKCQAWDPETGKYGPVYDPVGDEWSDNERYTTTKLNSAYALGGPKCLVKVIQKISGLAINRFMAVDFVGFSKMVDALGGVEVCSTTPLEDAVLGTVLATAGRQTLDGHTALNYVRARSVTTGDNSDYGRIKRQQLFLSSLLRSIISTDTLFDLNRLDVVVNVFIADSYVDNVRTRDLVGLGQSLQGMNAGRISFVTVPTTGETDEEGNEIPRTADVRALFDAIIDDTPLPGENDNNETLSPVSATTSAAPTTQAWSASDSESDIGYGAGTAATLATRSIEEIHAVAADPRDVTVQVAEALGGNGSVDSATEQFELYGFSALTPDYYAEWSWVPTTTVYYSIGNEQAAATVAATLPGSRIERISGLGETVQVVLGPEFASVQYPEASGTTLNMYASLSGSSKPTKLPTDLTVTNGADVTCE